MLSENVSARGRQKAAAERDTQQLLEEKIAEVEARSKELDEYSEYMKTDEFADWYAKEKLGLIHKNEIIFKGE